MQGTVSFNSEEAHHLLEVDVELELEVVLVVTSKAPSCWLSAFSTWFELGQHLGVQTYNIHRSCWSRIISSILEVAIIGMIRYTTRDEERCNTLYAPSLRVVVIASRDTVIESADKLEW